MNVADKIKKHRIQKNLSQGDLAKLVGCGQKTVSNWELGKFEPTAAFIPKLAATLDIKIEELTLTPELYDEYKEQMKNDNMVIKLIDSLYDGGVISKNNIPEKIADIIIDKIKEYLATREQH